MSTDRAAEERSAPDETAPCATALFINGFHRSGTTLLTAAATEATQGVTLTVGHLARHLPALRYFLRVERRNNRTPDRGVDELPVTDSTPEEYGWLLRRYTGRSRSTARAASSGILARLVEELAAGSRSSVVVLKNPPDTGRERLLLDQLPGSRMLLVRRSLGAIEDSVGRAVSRATASSGYPYALVGSSRDAGAFKLRLWPVGRWVAMRITRWTTRVTVVRLAYAARRLPMDRVAFLSYDELRQDQRSGAMWAAHLLDAEALARSVAAHAFPEYRHEEAGSWLVRLIDAYWARGWRRARAAQIRAGLLPDPSGSATGRNA